MCFLKRVYDVFISFRTFWEIIKWYQFILKKDPFHIIVLEKKIKILWNGRVVVHHNRTISEWYELSMGYGKAFFLQMQPNFVTHIKLMLHLVLIMSLFVIGIWLLQYVVNLLVDVLDAFNKSGHFISVAQYMCGFCLCSRMRHGNINWTQWLKF